MHASLHISESLLQIYKPLQTREQTSNDRKSKSDETTHRKMYKMISTGSADICVP